MDTKKVLAIDSVTYSIINPRHHPEIVKRYDPFRKTNGFIIYFVNNIKSAKADFNYARYNPKSDATYSLLTFNPSVSSIDKRELQLFLELARKYIPVLMCAPGPEEDWAEKGYIKKVHYDNKFNSGLISLSSLNEFSLLETAMYSCIRDRLLQK